MDKLPDPAPGTAQQVAVGDNDLVQLDSMDQFAYAVSAWHGNKVQVLTHMQNIPVGTEMEVTVGEKQVTLKLEGDVMDAFQAGIQLALIEFGSLPFISTTEDTPDAAPAPQGE